MRSVVLVLLAVLSAGFWIGCDEPPVEAAPPVDLEAPLGEPAQRLEELELERARAAADPRFAPQLEGGPPILDGAVRAVFERDRTELVVGASRASFGLAAIGRGERRRALSTSAPAVSGVEVQREPAAGIVEWWRALPRGLEHGVTLTERPPGSGALALEIAVEGALEPRAASDEAVVLVDEGGRIAAHYAELLVVDADRSPIAARMRVEGARIVIEIDDADARYPLVVDPLVAAQEGFLTGLGGGLRDWLGRAVSLSADGSRAIVGAHADDTAAGTDAGSAVVFVRTGTTWTREATLTASDAAASDNFGSSVAIAPDGLSVIVGVLRDDTPAGADAGSARIFVRSGSTWTETATLLATGAAASDQLGSAVALSSDGSRAIVGAALDDTASGTNAGSARIFLRSGTSWAQETTLALASGGTNDFFGSAVGMTDAGDRVIVGAYWDDNAGGADAGSAYVYRRSGTAWSLEGAPLLAESAAASDYFGASVAISADGARAIVGAVGSETAHVFTRASTTWAHEARLVGSAWNYGTSVALDSTGVRAVVGAPLDYSDAGIDAGSARVYARTGSSWVQEVELLSSPFPLGGAGDHLGESVSISADGSRVLVGVPYDDVSAQESGSARVFTLRAPNDGTICTSASECTSGICVDGVCCASACGDGAVDCQACSIAAGGTIDGTCTPLSATAAPTVSCRAAAGECDREETCSPSSTLCAINQFLPPTTVCRASAGVCDAAERCTGGSAACPSDQRVAFGTSCRAAAGDCDVAEHCDGVAVGCPADTLLTSFTVCRAAAGVCDAAERCDGVDPSCPADSLEAPGAPCRPSVGACDVPESCSGADSACPADVLAGSGVECRAATGVCDVAEACTGASGACPSDGFVLAGTECRAAADVCDLAEACTGSGGACPSDGFVLAGTECRAAAEVCDAAESCTGASARCPGDGFVATGTECRAAVGACDVAESCTGSSGGCPSDALAASGIECRASAGDCDAAESCTGASSECPSDVLLDPSTECRASAGPCDVAETCSGAGASCPIDASEPDGTSCADGDACDGDEVCSAGVCGAGTALSCDDDDACTADACDAAGGCTHEPIDGCCDAATDCDDGDSCTDDRCDASLCVHDPLAGCGADGGSADAGVTDAGADDAAVGGDAGTTEEVAGGCGCAVPRRSGGGGPLAIGALLIGVLVVLRRRRS